MATDLKPLIATRTGGINWAVPNIVTAANFALAWMVIFQANDPLNYVDVGLGMFGVVAPYIAIGTLLLMLILGIRLNVGVYLSVIDAYIPESPVGAKRANEQIKYVTSLFNNLATAFIVVLALDDVLRLNGVNPYKIWFGFLFAFLIHIMGRNLLGRLKDEADIEGNTQPPG